MLVVCVVADERVEEGKAAVKMSADRWQNAAALSSL